MKPTRNFVILFSEKEGTTPLIHLLDHFDRVTVVHHVNNRGWEPFDRHQCGPMTNADMGRAMDLIFRPGPVDMDALNRLYLKTGKRPFLPIEKRGAVGFKMRPRTAHISPPPDHVLKEPWRPVLFRYRNRQHRKMLVETFLRHDVTVLLAIRQDIFRWALSKYHGDGKGNPGQLQFKVARKGLSPEDLGKIEVDLDRFSDYVRHCRREMTRKRRLEEYLRAAGLRVFPIRYEDFCGDKVAYFQDFFRKIRLEVSEEEIRVALGRGTRFRKVHANDISQFVHNAEELQAAFGDHFMTWADPVS